VKAWMAESAQKTLTHTPFSLYNKTPSPPPTNFRLLINQLNPGENSRRLP
jgi:hypothetical protein